ncbi:hypothetical protein OS738_004658 [Salmonella enterica]|nr:hypothetical protein [Salmonella enterica]EKE0409066.1 hypothetical protein [Salmonella enterica]
MVARYRFNYVQEMFETDAGEQYCETERDEWVKYEDYAALHALMCRLTDQVNLRELSDGLYDDLEKAGLL